MKEIKKMDIENNYALKLMKSVFENCEILNIEKKFNNPFSPNFELDYLENDNPTENEIKQYDTLTKNEASKNAESSRKAFIAKLLSLPKDEAEKLGYEHYGPNWKIKLGLTIPETELQKTDIVPKTQSAPTPIYKKVQINNNTQAENEEIIGQPKNENLRYDIQTRVRLRSIYEGDYSKREFIKPGFPVGVVGSLVAPGGSSKTFKVLQDALLLAATEEYRPPCGVLYLPAEDSMDEIGLRIQAIIKAYGMTEEEIDLGNDNFQVWSLLAESPDLLEKKGESRPLVDAICEIAKSYKRDPLRLVIFDTLRRFSYADENDGGAMSKILSVMELICKKCGCSCLFLHHTTKSAALANLIDVQQASRGSSVLVDNLRYQEFLRIMTTEEANIKGEIINGCLPTVAIGEDNRKQYVCWGISKQNYGSIVEDQWYKRNEAGVLLKVNLGKVQEKKKENNGRRCNEL